MKKITKEIEEYIINSYNNMSLLQITKELHIDILRIKKILMNNNIPIRGIGEIIGKRIPNQKYTYDENYFESINNEQKAYWLGFIFADGNVSKPKNSKNKGSLDIALKDDDDYHLYSFRNDIKGNMGIKYREIKNNNKIYKSCRISIFNMKIANDLIKLGCVPNKSLILKFPKHLSDNLLPHFIRGYFDGDGCIFFKKYIDYKVLTFSLLGTKDFLENVKIILETNGIECRNVKQSHSKAFNMNIHGQENITNLYNYLYKDATRFLIRKIDIFRNGIINCNKQYKLNIITEESYQIHSINIKSQDYRDI